MDAAKFLSVLPLPRSLLLNTLWSTHVPFRAWTTFLLRTRRSSHGVLSFVNLGSNVSPNRQGLQYSGVYEVLGR